MSRGEAAGERRPGPDVVPRARAGTQEALSSQPEGVTAHVGAWPWGTCTCDERVHGDATRPERPARAGSTLVRAVVPPSLLSVT